MIINATEKYKAGVQILSGVREGLSGEVFFALRPEDQEKGAMQLWAEETMGAKALRR